MMIPRKSQLCHGREKGSCETTTDTLSRVERSARPDIPATGDDKAWKERESETKCLDVVISDGATEPLSHGHLILGRVSWQVAFIGPRRCALDLLMVSLIPV